MRFRLILVLQGNGKNVSAVLYYLSWNADLQLDLFALRIESGDHFLLPMSSIWKTGNHRAHLADGNLRRQFAEKLARHVRGAFNGEAPYRPTCVPTRDRHFMSRVLIWSLDCDLSCYDTGSR
jgi:hypothetical protein